jgi:glycosyltransferase involved in cell wall biosynthesis
VSEGGLAGRVTFAGRRDDVPDVLAAADLLILPSESETAPLTVLEGMAAGLPVVATNVGGVGEAVRDGVTGLLIEPRQPRAIAEAVLSIAALPDGGAAMGSAGREVVRLRFSSERLVAAVTKLYEGLLGGGVHA